MKKILFLLSFFAYNTLFAFPKKITLTMKKAIIAGSGTTLYAACVAYISHANRKFNYTPAEFEKRFKEHLGKIHG